MAGGVAREHQYSLRPNTGARQRDAREDAERACNVLTKNNQNGGWDKRGSAMATA
jgi:hypothetical protein